MKRIALVTGGQQGIGLGISDALVKAGFEVVWAAELPEDAQSVCVGKEFLGSNVTYFQHDLRCIGSTGDLLDRIEREKGPVAAFVSNAGVPPKVRGDMLEMAPENFDYVMDVNLKGAFFLAQQVAQRMLRQPAETYRSITFVTSVSAELVSVERAEYCLSKAAASMMTKLFAARLAEAGIGVFELRPGIIETPMTSGVKDTYTTRIEQGLVPARRWGQPADIGSVVVPLAHGQFAFATGSVIAVDGGLSIHRL
ncbi:NAD(P)-dependent dehydrogenase (short-subunit alcohol dehydrogenase family) [Roseibium hamelinense]|uniref:NAD(P)-dependent dehydrogenase (Short-subunit alcohol dehydrogenase family) n=1 Tax=Roseibium hamelinense TaxID=150831 RepID=A0A562SZB4_9HYPH|nr:3-ketoacyl-ACP reductase [Roseibium hamelinense]MTI44808.1 3-ketoacyl-ACP reductase [Roseibium hamelinense]TWI86000.1 NAD(P)-dependent dehydrogenase (short-subunit alcohol dehydrogenase family) [Roseibium hamelinense]